MAEAQVLAPAPKEEVATYLPAGPAETSEQHPETKEDPREEKTAEFAEEKTVQVAEEGKADEGASESHAEVATGSPTHEKSFKEESYRVGDLKESERKALEDFKFKVEEAIKARMFEKPSKPEVTREVEVVKPSEEAEKKDESEAKEGEGEATVVEAEAKPEEVVAVIETPATSYQESSPPVEEKSKVESLPAEVGVTEEKSVTGEGAEVPSEEAGREEVVVEKTGMEVAGDETEEEDYCLWGVPLLHAKGDERTDVILLKFLRARDYKVNEAFDMLRNTVSWRKDFSADSVVEEDLDADFDTAAYLHGHDKEGHPVCYNDYGLFQDKELYHKTFGDEAGVNKFIRWRVQVVEKSIQKLNFSPGGVHSLVQITDLKHSPGFLKWINITNKAVTILQDNYPELVAKQIFINVPWYFGALYSIYGRLITQRQKSKVVVARPGKLRETLFKYISPEQVPIKYGGLSRSDDSEFEGIEVPATEVIVKSGEKHTIELPVEEPGGTVIWDIVIVGWEVVYGEEFVPSAEGGYTVIVKKSRRVPASEEPMRNSFKVTEPGKIMMTIDNSTSKRKRLAIYRHLVKKPIHVESH